MKIKYQLLELLSNLPNTQESRQRQGLIAYVDLNRLAPHIEWEGSTFEFFSGLIDILAGEGREVLLAFIEQLRTSPWVGLDRQAALAEIHANIEALNINQWREEFIGSQPDVKETIERFKRVTAQEIKIVGSKYIPELYFSRLQVESDFQRFLDSEATCFLVVAKAGRGKTNLMCHIVNNLQGQRPVLFLSGRLEPKDSNGILRHISSRLGYGENWTACLRDLRYVAGVALEPLIIIDGINESAAEPKIMQDALRELLIQATLHRVKVCVTCRTDFWKFYRASFWGEYTWRETSSSTRVIRGEDLPLFPEQDFETIVDCYFRHFDIQGRLVDEAWERCRHPLLLRFFCEAYRSRNVQIVSQIRLYLLLKLFWERKVEQVQEILTLSEPYRINNLILTVAQLMYQHYQTKISKETIAQTVGQDLTQPGSLYLRVLDEEIILEEELDELKGTANVIFVYDKFSEYAIALSIFSNFDWITKTSGAIVNDARRLMQEETEHHFATLRGAMEFLVLRLEDCRFQERTHLALIEAMLDYDWKWRRIGSLVAFQLTRTEEASFWEFMATLTRNDKDFVRRICAEQLCQLARFHADHALPLLNECLQDDSNAVRQTARESLLNLNAATAIREVEILISEKPLAEKSTGLAAEILLYPIDSRSTLLQEKIRWLVRENHNDDIQEAVFQYLRNFKRPPYKDLYALEEWKNAFQVDWKQNYQPSNPYLEVIRSILAPKQEVLKIDLQRIETLRTIVNQLLDLTRNIPEIQEMNFTTLLGKSLETLLPNSGRRKEFLKGVGRYFQFPLLETLERLQENLYSDAPPRIADAINLFGLAVEIARSTPSFSTNNSTSYLVELPSSQSYFWDYFDSLFIYSRLIRLCEIANYLVQDATLLAIKNPSASIIMSTELGECGLNLEPEKRTAFRNEAASKIGIEITPVEHRSLYNLGRLSLWLLQAEATLQEREQSIEKKVEEVTGLEINNLQQKLSAFEIATLSEESRRELVLYLQACCRVYADSQSSRIAQAFVPLIVWHSENDSPALSQAFQSLYWLERDGFWSVAASLLEQDDQRLIDFGSQVLEQAEYQEDQGYSGEIFEKIRGIIAEQLGLDPSEITPDSNFTSDLGADSLDLVELVMAVEEEFDIEIPDEAVEQITTLGEAIRALTEKLAQQ